MKSSMMVMEKKTLKRCRSMSLAENIAECEDILIEILVRLPARPLTRFKCVSKRWLFLISDQHLCHRHTLHNPRPSISSYFVAKSSEFGFTSLDLHHDHRESFSVSQRSGYPQNSGVEILQSCNGLFLCRPLPPNGVEHTKATSLVYYVLNPTTNKVCLLIPPAAAAATTVYPRIFGCALAFDPSKSPHYRVVFLWFSDEPSRGYSWWGPNSRIEIYSSETRSWELLDSCFINRPCVGYFAGVYFNGAVHWLGTDCEVFYYHIDERRVALVDGGLPENYGRYFNSVMSRYFQESHGGTHLHLIDIRRTYLTKLEVKEMGKNYSGWSIKYNVDLDHLYAAYPLLRQKRFVVLSRAAEENEKDEDNSSLLLHYYGIVIYYNLRNNTVKSAEVIPKDGINHDSNFHCVESLAVV